VVVQLTDRGLRERCDIQTSARNETHPVYGNPRAGSVKIRPAVVVLRGCRSPRTGSSSTQSP